MLISVIYPSGRHDMIKDFMLGRMIELGEITQFKRKDGWVNIETDQIRKRNSRNYEIIERREHGVVIPTELTEIFANF